MKQFYDRNVVKSLMLSDVTSEIRKKTFGYLMFLKQKRSGSIKGRGCADGGPQRVYKSKAETSSPTAAIELVFITGLIDAQERRDVAVVDIPGVFLQTAANSNTIIK